MFKKSILALALVASPFIVLAYTEPPVPAGSCDPSIPACNPPINVSAINQTKVGGLGVGNYLTISSVGTNKGFLRLVDSDATNYIQSGTSSAANSFKDLAFGPIGVPVSWMIIKGTTGNVGIGTWTPSAKLDIVSATPGAIRLADGTQGVGKVLTSNTNGLATWQTPGSTGVTSLTAIGAVPNANGATLSGQVLNLQPASASYGGVVTTGAQTFAGNKTFLNNTTTFTDADGAVGVQFNGGSTNLLMVSQANSFDIKTTSAGKGVKLATVGGSLLVDSTGLTTFSGQVKIAGGTPGLNKILASDASGLASWVSTSTLFTPDFDNWTLSGANVYRATGNVGIGTASPTAKLQVAGTVKVTGTGSTLDMGSNQIKSVAEPTVNSDAATKYYVDNKGINCYVQDSGDTYPPWAGAYMTTYYWYSPRCNAGYTMTGAWCWVQGSGGNPRVCAVQTYPDTGNVQFYTDVTGNNASRREGHMSCCKISS